jgi:hypothetical protein
MSYLVEITETQVTKTMWYYAERVGTRGQTARVMVVGCEFEWVRKCWKGKAARRENENDENHLQ